MDLLINLIIFLCLLSVGFVFGNILEKNHYKKIKNREKIFLNLPSVTIEKAVDHGTEIKEAKLVYGSVVISSDYFKDFIASLKTFFGGRLTSYESLMDRARREAILRMKEKAMGADIIINMRIETSEIGSNRNKNENIVSVETIAYGTAITYR